MAVVVSCFTFQFTTFTMTTGDECSALRRAVGGHATVTNQSRQQVAEVLVRYNAELRALFSSYRNAEWSLSADPESHSPVSVGSGAGATTDRITLGQLALLFRDAGLLGHSSGSNGQGVKKLSPAQLNECAFALLMAQFDPSAALNSSDEALAGVLTQLHSSQDLLGNHKSSSSSQASDIQRSHSIHQSDRVIFYWQFLDTIVQVASVTVEQSKTLPEKVIKFSSWFPPLLTAQTECDVIAYRSENSCLCASCQCSRQRPLRERPLLKPAMASRHLCGC